MAKTSEEKIALLKQYWSEGYSIPEVARLAGVGLTTAKKYLAEEVEAYTSSKAAIELPQAVDLLADEEWLQLVDYEFSVAANYEEVRDLYYHYKPQAIANDVRANAFRLAHDLATKRIGLIKTITANKTKIISWRNKLGVNIPIEKDCDDYDELRLYEHLVYWVHKRKHKLKHSQCLEYVQSLDLQARKNYLEKLVKID